MLTLPGMPVLRLVQVEARRSQHDRRTWGAPRALKSWPGWGVDTCAADPCARQQPEHQQHRALLP